MNTSNSEQGGKVNPLVYADMAYVEYPNGGAVFSTSSIAWSGSLSFNGYDNNVSRLTENVLRRFASDEPLPGPAGAPSAAGPASATPPAPADEDRRANATERMYQVVAWSALRQVRRNAGARFGWPRVPRNVWALGFTSLFTDVSSEMVGTVLPVYLVLYLGLTPFQFGIVDGLHHGVTALLRLASGVAVDRGGRCKEIASWGYGASAVSRLALLAAGASWPLIAGAVAFDRAAKGARTVPRDVLISLSSPTDRLATAFGVHRALDSAGAMLGPLVALTILAALPDAFDVVFVASFSVAVIGLGVLLLFVTNADRPHRASPAPVTPLAAARGILELPGLLRVTVAATMLGAATVGDGFLYLLLQQAVGFSPGLFPLLYVGTSACYLLLAVPAGRLADRIGRQRALLAGYVLLGAACALTLESEIGPLGVAGCLLLLGGHYALTDGVLMALASGLLPRSRRGSGLALLTTATSLSRLLASVLFGTLWTRYGVGTAIPVFLVALGAAIGVAAVVLRGARGADHDSSN